MANDFSGDASCKALWRFENGALVTDSIGSNTLINNSAVSSDTTNFQEGAGSALFDTASAQFFSITDANLDAGFPLKSGDSNLKITICKWFRPDATTSDRALFSKFVSAGTLRSILLYKAGDVKIKCIISPNGSTVETLAHDSVLVTATWYHITFFFDNSDKSWGIRIRDTSFAVVGSDAGGTATNNIAATTALLQIGATEGGTTWTQDGNLDEMPVFDRKLTETESTDIAKGIFGAGVGVTRRTLTLLGAGV
jgi:hypothetical protein